MEDIRPCSHNPDFMIPPDQTIRMDCLRLAVDRNALGEHQSVLIPKAQAFYDFVTATKATDAPSS